MLCTLLLPSLGNARDQARTTRCLANLRQLGASHLLYAAEFQNQIVPAEYRDPAVPGPNVPKINDNWPNLFVNLTLIPTQGNQQLDRAVTPPKTPMAMGVFCCPSGQTDAFSSGMPYAINDPEGIRPRRLHSVETKEYVDVWYGMNGTLPIPARHSNHWLPGRRIRGDSITDDSSLGRSSSKHGGDVVLLLRRPLHEPVLPGSRLPCRKRTYKRESATNLVFVDGHAETVAQRAHPRQGGHNTIGTVTTPATIAADFWPPALREGVPALSRWTFSHPPPEPDCPLSPVHPFLPNKPAYDCVLKVKEGISDTSRGKKQAEARQTAGSGRRRGRFRTLPGHPHLAKPNPISRAASALRICPSTSRTILALALLPTFF